MRRIVGGASKDEGPSRQPGPPPCEASAMLRHLRATGGRSRAGIGGRVHSPHASSAGTWNCNVGSVVQIAVAQESQQGGTTVRRSFIITAAMLGLAASTAARADDLKIALI